MDIYYLTQLILALHIVSVIGWTSAILYLARLFVYHRELQQGKDPFIKRLWNEGSHDIVNQAIMSAEDRFTLMQSRLYFIIATPAMLAAVMTGLHLAFITNQLAFFWLALKIMLVMLMIVYHIGLFIILKKLQSKKINIGSVFLRFYNELAIIIIVYIVFLVSFKAVKPASLYGSIAIASVAVVFFTFSAVAAFFKKGKKGSASIRG